MPRYRILFLDDEPDAGFFVSELLDEDEVVTFTSPTKALTCIQKESFDLLISDITMPEMTGLEFYKKLRATGNQAPFVLVTGHRGGVPEYEEAKSLGIELLHKPYSGSDLLNILEKLIK